MNIFSIESPPSIFVVPFSHFRDFSTFFYFHRAEDGHALIVASDGLWDAFSDDDAGEVRSSVPPVLVFRIELRHQHRYLEHVPVGNC